MLKRMTSAALILALAACSNEGVANYSDEAVDIAMESAPAERAAASPAEPASSPPADAPETPATAPMLAYAYRYEIEAPTAQVAPLMARHEQACIAAGAAVCQIVGARVSQSGRDHVTAELEMRATPAYVARFRSGVDADAEEAGGQVTDSSTESEDLTRAIVDTEAALRAKTTLRDRLQQLLATRNAPLDQLLQLEQELARVQGEIDATQSRLAVMRTRVATSRLTVRYVSEGVMAPDSALAPARAALENALGLFMQTVGAIISVAAVLAPLALIAAPPAWWILRRRRQRRNAGPAPAASPRGPRRKPPTP